VVGTDRGPNKDRPAGCNPWCCPSRHSGQRCSLHLLLSWPFGREYRLESPLLLADRMVLVLMEGQMVTASAFRENLDGRRSQMSLPGFTAESSLYKVTDTYRVSAEAGEKRGARLVIPQFYPIPPGWGGPRVVTFCNGYGWCRHLICDDSGWGICRPLYNDLY
jgi:hypothetical protein